MNTSRTRASWSWIVGILALAGPVVAEDSKNQVPLTKIVLYSSGVGFFERAAEIEGNAKVELQFNVDDVNDLLKSMVLQDLGGGNISAVTYGSRDPITKTLKTFAIDLTENPTLADLLGQIRGERIELDAPNKIEGVIVGIEKRKRQVGEKDTIETAYLNLLTEEGLRSVSLEQVGRLKLSDPKLDAELRQALATLAMSHATDKKSVTMDFAGQGKRPVRVGYVQQSPIWKTSYRLVLSDEGSPLLQGWAIVENTSEEDWKDVKLTLVSGRPVSFVMDLYQPLYLARPVVQPELFASLMPQKYGRDMLREEAAKVAPGEEVIGTQSIQSPMRFGRRDRSEAETDAAPMMAAPAEGLPRGGMGGADGRSFEMRDDVGFTAGSIIGKSAAQAAELGALFQYAIQQPVNLPRQQSAMLPIVNGAVEGERLSIYNAAVHPKHPLAGLRLTNNTGLHLMQGPITVFDGGSYAGDAQIEDLPPDTKRLISYAMDLDVEVSTENPLQTSTLSTVAIRKGTLVASYKMVREVSYRVKSSDMEAKTVLIEQPTEGGWTLVEPKEVDEKTRDRYRIAVKALPGKPVVLPIKEEMTMEQVVAMTDLDESGLRVYQAAKKISPAVRQALEELVKRNAEISDIGRQIDGFQQRMAAITEEQNRIRQNMERLERNSELYLRYVKKFGAQEDEVERLRTQINETTVQRDEAIRLRDTFLLGLDVE